MTVTGLFDKVYGYLHDWWNRYGGLVKALIDEVLLYACLILFVVVIHGMLRLAGMVLGDEEVVLNKAIHKWSFVACDVAIASAFVKKVIVLSLMRPH